MRSVADGKKANVVYDYQLFYFWAFCPIRTGVLPNNYISIITIKL